MIRQGRVRDGFSVMAVGVLGLALVGGAAAQAPSAKDLVNTMLANERTAAAHKVRYAYTSNERSERTEGHLWTERVVETPTCKVRLLKAIDGKPLSPDLAQAERNRLSNDAAHPDEYAARDKQLNGSDDAHAQAMLELIPHGFLLENVKSMNGDWRIDFKPDPNFSPNGTEEKVLHGMVGWLLIDQKSMRLHHIEGQLPQDVSLYGFLASVHAGSRFESTKMKVDDTWRTTKVVTDIRGKAALFKNIGKNMEAARGNFHLIGQNLSVAQAVEIVEK